MGVFLLHEIFKGALNHEIFLNGNDINITHHGQ